MTVKSIIAAECCNHFYDGPGNTDHWCVAKDAVCPMFACFKRCQWFEKAVLPAWPDVAAEYAAMRGQMSTDEITVTRQAICQSCGEAYKAENNRQQYCSDECVKAGNNAKSKERMRKRRDPVPAAV